MGMFGAIDKAKQINKDIPNSIILDQFSNKANLPFIIIQQQKKYGMVLMAKLII